MSANTSSAIFEGAYWIRNKSNKFVLGIGTSGNDSVSTGDQLDKRRTLANQSQMWLVEPLSDGVRFRIRNAQTARVLDVQASGTSDGTPVILYQQTNNDNQHWKFEWINDSDGSVYYRISNIYAKKALTLTSNSEDPIVSSSWNNVEQQYWAFEPVVFPPVYRISHAQTGWYLQLDAGSATAENKIPSTDRTLSQLWFLEPVPNTDGYMIRSLEDEKKVLDLSGSGTADGTPVIAYDCHGGPNQQWKIVDIKESDPQEDRVRIVSVVANTVVQVVEGPASGNLQAQTNHEDTSQSWRFHQYPFPSVYWSTLQNLKTGIFLRQDGNKVTPSTGMASALDYSVQWRSVPDPTLPTHYTVINRATGWVLTGKKQTPTVTAAEATPENHLWVVERAGDGIAVINTSTVGALDHYDGGSTIEAYPDNGTSDPYHQWISVQVAGRVPSFALVNSRTGRSLAFKSSTEKGGIVMSPDTVHEWNNQWHFENLSGTDNDTPVYAIISKVSGTVLDHWGGERIEAYTDDTSDPHHRWTLIPCPCGENYFQIQNVATSHYLEERADNVPNANATTSMDPNHPTDNDRAQCWELVSNRIQGFDIVTLDDDVLQRTLPYFQKSDSETIGHRIVKRAPGREKKGKNKDAHKPQNPRLLRDISPLILDIFSHVINQWVEDRLPTNVQAGTRVSTTRGEVEQEWGIFLPRSLLAGHDRPGWIRIDVQGTYEASPGVRVANIQGQWNNDSVFHVIVPLGVNVGREVIRGAMRRSLNEQTSIALANANSGPPGGGSKPGTTPKPPPGPGGSGNGWVFFAAAIIPIILLSPLGF